MRGKFQSRIESIERFHQSLVVVTVLGILLIAVWLFGRSLVDMIAAIVTAALLYYFFEFLIGDSLKWLASIIIKPSVPLNSEPSESLARISSLDGDGNQIIEQYFQYKHVFSSLTWISLLPGGILVLTTSAYSGLVILACGSAALIVFTGALAKRLSVAIIPSEVGYLPIPVEKSIDRGELGKDVISNSENLELLASRLAQDNDHFLKPYYWGGLPIRDKSAAEHFFIHGDSGSGKSIVLKDMISQALARQLHQKDVRIFIDDPKQDMIPMLNDLGVSHYICVNPMAELGYGWDLSKDICSSAQAKAFGELMFPNIEGKSRYFSKAGANAVEIVLNYFNLVRPQSGWGFRDLILAFESYRSFEAIANRTREGRTFLEFQSDNKETFSNVMSTIISEMNDLSSLAAAIFECQEQGRSFSIQNWCNRKDSFPVLVLTRHPRSTSSLKVLQRLLFYFIAKETEMGPPVSYPRTWIFLDEARLVADIPELSEMVDMGRSKGMTLVMATQSYKDLNDAAKRNPNASSRFASRIANKILLAAKDEDAEWCSKQFGEAYKKALQEGVSVSTSANGTSTNRSYGWSEVKVDAVKKSSFLELPKASYNTGCSYYVVSDASIGGGLWFDKMSGSNFPPKPRTDSSFRWKEDAGSSFLPPWSDEERQSYMLDGEGEFENEITVKESEYSEPRLGYESQDFHSQEEDVDRPDDDDHDYEEPRIPGRDF